MSAPLDDNSKRRPPLKFLSEISISSHLADDESLAAVTDRTPSQIPRGGQTPHMPKRYVVSHMTRTDARKIVDYMLSKNSNAADLLSGLTTPISLDTERKDSNSPDDEEPSPNPPSGGLPNGQNNVAVLKSSFKEVEENAKAKSDLNYIVKFKLGVLVPGDDLEMLIGKVVSWTNPNASLNSNGQLVKEWKEKLAHHHKKFKSNFQKFVDKFGLVDAIADVRDMDRVKELFQIKAEVEMEVYESLHKMKLGLGPGNPVRTKIKYIEEVQRIESQTKLKGKPNPSSP